MSASTRSAFVSATTPRPIPSSRQISKCSRVCGLIDSSAATTAADRCLRFRPACSSRSARAPEHRRNPPHAGPNSACANPKSIVMPRRFSSSSRSASMPVSAFTNAVLPWSICPAVPTMMFFIRLLQCRSAPLASASPRRGLAGLLCPHRRRRHPLSWRASAAVGPPHTHQHPQAARRNR